ncbi:CLUMA_CG015647, isoform A [Clunio marinus]|uniref:CLUMA_CG015647, isoform A n=1 Tax=Clunio marinus TaxID=568069 RepID=A0A1J1INT3_9DIPT|nr:CLUMA_CG015647, isoform A [Clunio marinus]
MVIVEDFTASQILKDMWENFVLVVVLKKDILSAINYHNLQLITELNLEDSNEMLQIKAEKKPLKILQASAKHKLIFIYFSS